jgi:two-component system chemotaxis response regulator CheB
LNSQTTKLVYPSGFCKTIVAIGASIGGPKALCELFSKIPTGLNAAFLIVQHLPPGFVKSIAHRLDSLSPLTVKEAEHGEKIKADYVYLAPDNYHLKVGFLNNKLSLILQQSPNVNGHRPSVDVLMSSIAKINCLKIGVIMTGMGSDGAKGMLKLKKAGALNIGESAETCVVYGMSKASYELGALDYEVPLYKIADYIVQALKKC